MFKRREIQKEAILKKDVGCHVLAVFPVAVTESKLREVERERFL